MEYSTVPIIATEKTRTAKSAVCYLLPDPFFEHISDSRGVALVIEGGEKTESGEQQLHRTSGAMRHSSSLPRIRDCGNSD